MSKKQKQPFPITDPTVKAKLAEYCQSEYEPVGGFLYNHWVMNHEDKRQLTQETFYRLTEFVSSLSQQGSDVALEFLKDENHVRGWLMTTAGYLSFNHHRRAALSRKYLSAIEAKLEALDAIITKDLNARCPTGCPETESHVSSVINKLTVEELRRKLKDGGVRPREIFEMLYKGKSTAEIDAHFDLVRGSAIRCLRNALIRSNKKTSKTHKLQTTEEVRNAIMS
jgi:DNA-directed RNA polymerase specialized sigma24 family protein